MLPSCARSYAPIPLQLQKILQVIYINAVIPHLHHVLYISHFSQEVIAVPLSVARMVVGELRQCQEGLVA